MSPKFLHAGWRFLTRAEAAELLRVHEKTLERWAIEGTGPPFRRHGRRVLYALSDLLSWSEKHARMSTSSPSAA